MEMFTKLIAQLWCRYFSFFLSFFLCLVRACVFVCLCVLYKTILYKMFILNYLFNVFFYILHFNLKDWTFSSFFCCCFFRCVYFYYYYYSNVITNKFDVYRHAGKPKFQFIRQREKWCYNLKTFKYKNIFFFNTFLSHLSSMLATVQIKCNFSTFSFIYS